ncbi:MAG: tetratricopeptide repeat protein [Spirochaetes bacterium]|nr:tetratricopeptide repeat protein [Spirochaetota bacterium]
MASTIMWYRNRKRKYSYFFCCLFVVLFFLPFVPRAEENRAEEIVKKIIAGEKLQKERPPLQKNYSQTEKENSFSNNSSLGNTSVFDDRKIQAQKKDHHAQPNRHVQDDSAQQNNTESTSFASSKDDVVRKSKESAADATASAEKKKKTELKMRTTPDEALYKAGIDYFNANLFSEAIKSFDELKTKHTDSPRLQSALTYMGKAYMRIGEYPKASETLAMVSPESGEYPASLFHLAESQIGMGKKDDAIATLYRLSIQYPQTSFADDALLRLSQIFLLEKKGHQALDAAVKIVQLYSDRETIDDAYFMIGQIYEKDPMLRDVEISRKIYRIFLQKSKAGEKFFFDSPLKKRVTRELKSLERKYFRYEQ